MDWPLLVIAPSSMRMKWSQDIEENVCVEGDKVRVLLSNRDSMDNANIVIISYDMVKTRKKELAERRFGVVICDESHYLKNAKAARYKSAASLVTLARRCVLLSGTPALSRPNELFSQLRLIDNRLFNSHHEFGIRYW